MRLKENIKKFELGLGVKKLKVFLPKGNWIGLFDGIHYKGGEQEVDAPRGKPIAFYLEGTKHQKLFEKFIKEK